MTGRRSALFLAALLLALPACKKSSQSSSTDGPRDGSQGTDVRPNDGGSEGGTTTDGTSGDAEAGTANDAPIDGPPTEAGNDRAGEASGDRTGNDAPPDLSPSDTADGGPGDAADGPAQPTPSRDWPCSVEGWGSLGVAAFSRDGSLYAVGTLAGVVLILRTADDSQLALIAANDAMTKALAFSPDGSLLISGGSDGSVRVFRTSGELVGMMTPFTGSVRGVALSPDNSRAVAVGQVDNLGFLGQVMAVPDGQMVSRLRSPTTQDWANDVAFEASGATVVTTGPTITRWNTSNGARMTPIAYEQGSIGNVHLSTDGTTVAMADIQITVHDVRDGHLINRIAGNGTYAGLAVSGDGRRVASHASGAIGTFVDDVMGGTGGRLIADGAPSAPALALGRDGNDLVVGDDIKTYNDGIVHWRLAANDRVVTAPPWRGGILAFRLSPDGQWRVIVDVSGTARVQRLPSGTTYRTITRPAPGYTDAWFWPPDGTLMLVGENFVDLVTLPDGMVRAHPQSQVDGLLSAVSADGNLLAYAAPTSIVIRARDGTIKRTVPLPPTVSGTVAISPLGTQAAVGFDDGTLRILALDGGADVPATSAHGRGVRALAYTPDGRYVISAGGDGLGKLWQASDLATVRSFLVGTNPLQRVEVSPDGALVAIGTYGEDHRARLFRIADASLMATFGGFGPPFPINGLAFTPDGRRVVVASFDNTLRTWCLP